MTTDRAHAEHVLASRLERDHAVLTGNGTTALWAALAALDLTPHTPVVYPDITCETAVNAAIFAGLAPVFTDVHPETAAANARDLVRTAVVHDAGALVPTHIFGRVDPPAQNGGSTIVDAAQAPVEPRSVTGGLAAVVSFGAGKQLDLGGGGALLTDDASFANDVRNLVNALHDDVDIMARERREVMMGLIEIGREHEVGSRGHAAVRSRLLREHRAGYLRPAGPDLPSRLMSGLATHDRHTRTRRASAWLLRDRLTTIPGVAPLDLGLNDSPWRLTFQVHARRQEVLGALSSAGLPATCLFPPAHRLVGGDDVNWPQAMLLAEALVNIDLSRLRGDPLAIASRLTTTLNRVLSQEGVA